MNIQTNKNKNKNRKNKRRVNTNNSNALSKQIPLSILGSTVCRDIDCLINVNAINTSLGTFYSLSTGLTTPTVSISMSALAAIQYSEYKQYAALNNLVQIKGFEILITRSSTLLTNTNVAGNLPSIFFQVSPNLQPNSTTGLTNVAIADNSNEYNICTFNSRNYGVNLPPIYMGKSSSSNDYFPCGSMVWLPTIYNGVISLPDVYLNLGSLSPPTFQSGAPNGAYQVAQVHIKMKVVFASPTIQ